MLKFNPFTNKLDFIQDISGKLNIDQTTPQTTVGRFNFPNIAVDTDTIYTDSVNHRVGIGTTAPGEKLEINGNLYLNNEDPIIYGYNKSTYIDMYDTSGGIIIKPLTAASNVNILGNAVISGNLSFTGDLSLAPAALIKSSGNSIQLYDGSDASMEFKITHQTVGHFKWFDKDNNNIMILTRAGNVGIGTTSPTAKLDVDSDILRLRTAKTPATSGSSGNQGDIAWDADYMYVCVATNTWKRSALTTL